MPALKPTRGLLLNKSHLFARGLVGLWLFNAGSGNKVFDLSGRGNIGTFGAGAASPSWTSGKIGTVLSFDGGQYIDFGVVDWPGTNDFTVIICFNSSQDTSFRLFDTRGKGALGTVKGVQLSWHEDVFWANTIVDDGAGNSVAGGGIADTWGKDGQRHQLAVVFRNSSGMAEFYTDGILAAIDTDAGLIGVNFTTATNLIMGANSNGTDDHFLTGLLDIPLVCNRALSACEIAFFYREAFCMFRRRTQPQMCFVEVVEPPVVARTRSHVGFRPIEGADRLRGLRRNALY